MPETNGTPIIFITASKNPELLQKVMDLGAVGLFEKPFDTEKLLSSIDRKLNRVTDLSNTRQFSVAN
jgi:FixJ family two-component response regulator